MTANVLVAGVALHSLRGDRVGQRHLWVTKARLQRAMGTERADVLTSLLDDGFVELRVKKGRRQYRLAWRSDPQQPSRDETWHLVSRIVDCVILPEPGDNNVQ